jgi:hypothetical protein
MIFYQESTQDIHFWQDCHTGAVSSDSQCEFVILTLNPCLRWCLPVLPLVFLLLLARIFWEILWGSVDTQFLFKLAHTSSSFHDYCCFRDSWAMTLRVSKWDFLSLPVSCLWCGHSALRKIFLLFPLRVCICLHQSVWFFLFLFLFFVSINMDTLILFSGLWTVAVICFASQINPHLASSTPLH